MALFAIALVITLINFLHTIGRRKPKEIYISNWYIVAAIIFGLVILTTIHAQDFRDMEGDSLKGQTTLPLIMGSKTSRTTLGASLMFWSIFCPYYLNLSYYAYALTAGFAGMTGLRFILKTDHASDKKSFHLYCLWVAAMLQLPAMAVA